jgi:hypothetical protein
MKKRVNLYTDAAIADLSDEQQKNLRNLARKELQRQVLDEELEALWSSVVCEIEPAAIGHGQTRCWIEVEVR